jgi:hypothetical protein
MNPLNTSNFGLAHHRMQHFVADVPPGTTDEQLTDRTINGMWVNVAKQLRVGDQITVRAVDCSFRAELEVIYISGHQVHTKILYRIDHEPISPMVYDDDAPYFIQLCGSLRYCIIERATGDRKFENIATKAQAERELSDYIKALAA